MPGRAVLIAWGLATALYALAGHAQVRVWQSDPALWCHAAIWAPAKPRPLINCAKARWAAGHQAEARHLLVYADALERARGHQ